MRKEIKKIDIARRKLLLIPCGVVLNIALSWKDFQFLHLPLFDLPSDYILLNTYLDKASNCFVFVVFSSVFDIVPPLNKPPCINCTSETIDFAKFEKVEK